MNIRGIPKGILGLALQMNAGRTYNPGTAGDIGPAKQTYIGSNPQALSKQIESSLKDPSQQYTALASMQSGMPIGAKVPFPNGNQVEYLGAQDDGTQKIAVHVPGQKDPVEKSLGSDDADHLLMQWAQQQGNQNSSDRGEDPSQLQGILAQIAGNK